MQRFRKGDVSGSVSDFDAAIAANRGMAPYMWQRGISLYYAGDYAQAAEQFRSDVTINPDDTEEAVWAFMSDAAQRGPAFARSQMLQVGGESRPYMRAAYDSFLEGTPEPVITVAKQATNPASEFYALFYAGLWYEAYGYPQQAREMVLAAAATPYARKAEDYMGACAQVHVQQRGWGADR